MPLIICTYRLAFGRGETPQQAYEAYCKAVEELDSFAYEVDWAPVPPEKCIFYEITSPIKVGYKEVPITTIQKTLVVEIS